MIHVNDAEHHLAQATAAAARAQHLLRNPATLDAYDWALVASLLVEADDEVQRARDFDASVQLTLLDAVLDELRDDTANFTNPKFLRASRSARRQKPNLFSSSRP